MYAFHCHVSVTLETKCPTVLEPCSSKDFHGNECSKCFIYCLIISSEIYAVPLGKTALRTPVSSWKSWLRPWVLGLYLEHQTVMWKIPSQGCSVSLIYGMAAMSDSSLILIMPSLCLVPCDDWLITPWFGCHALRGCQEAASESTHVRSSLDSDCRGFKESGQHGQVSSPELY